VGATAEEYETGLNAVAAPVRDAEGQVMAALSVSGPSYRFAVVSSPDVAPQLVVGAGELGRRLGHPG
jgi:DNA-binding IclR family transcriptional regulator